MADRCRLAIAFQSDKTPAEYEALADLVDGYGFDVVSVYNDLLYQPALGPLLIMARRLRRAALGPAALNPFTVHPLEIAGQIALLDMVSGGRAYLGLARGAWLEGIGITPRRPVRALREAALLVRHLLARRDEAFEGEIFRHPAGAPLRYQPPRARVPLMLGTWGHRTARLAGEVADEVKVGGSANPAMVAHLRPAIAQGERRRPADLGWRPPGASPDAPSRVQGAARANGSGPVPRRATAPANSGDGAGAVRADDTGDPTPHAAVPEASDDGAAGRVGICLGAVTVVDEDRAVARALARRQVAVYLTVVARLDPTTRDEDPEWLARVEAASTRGDVEAIARDIPDAVLDRFAFAGNPDDIAAQVERLRRAGATRVEFGTPHGVDPATGIRLLGERVLPQL